MPTDSARLWRSFSRRAPSASAHSSLVRIVSRAQPNRQGCLGKVLVGNIVTPDKNRVLLERKKGGMDIT